MSLQAFFSHVDDRLNLVGPLAQEAPVFAQPTLFVDGGHRFRPQTTSQPVLTVGDGDSNAPEHMDVLLPIAKDVSDLGFVLRELPARVLHLNLHGFLGGRRDHEWAVLGEVDAFLRTRPGASAQLFAASPLAPEVLAWGSGEHTYEIHGSFSIFTLRETDVRLVGQCHYLLEDWTRLLPLSSHGLSNLGRGKITLHTRGPVLMVRSTSSEARGSTTP